jgi:hypothetical protein
MNPEPSSSDARWSARRILLEVTLVAVAYALLATGGEWMLLGGEMDADSPGGPSLNIPASFLYWMLFGDHGGDGVFAFCVFLQWLVPGLFIGLVVAMCRRWFRDL